MNINCCHLGIRRIVLSLVVNPLKIPGVLFSVAAMKQQDIHKGTDGLDRARSEVTCCMIATSPLRVGAKAVMVVM
jgi:hypothetical protein